MTENFTVKQLLLAAGLSRNIKRKDLVMRIGVTEVYISQLANTQSFIALVERFKNIPLDRDTIEYKGIGTLKLMVGKFIYEEGERQIV